MDSARPTPTHEEPARPGAGSAPPVRDRSVRGPPAMRRVALAFGQAVAFLDRSRRVGWLDLALVAGLGAAIYGLVGLAREWTGALRPAVQIDLSLSALPGYTLLSLSRGLAAYVLSLLFTLGYGYWAARDRVAERVLIPALDILQSIPVLGFMPGLVLGLVGAFPRSNVGLELASVIMIFTGQAWNMTFSFYHSLKSIPPDLSEVATFARFGRWQRLRALELPFAAIGLVWNSMMSMAGGWFFLMVSEAFVLGDRDFRLPGLGSYMSVAVAQGDGHAMIAAVVAMTAMIVALDQLLWRPLVVWAQKFRVEESGQVAPMESWFLDVLRRSELVRTISGAAARLVERLAPAPGARAPACGSSPASGGGGGRAAARRRARRRRRRRSRRRRAERRTRSRTHERAGGPPETSATRKRCDHATRGLQRSWSTATIMTTIARTAQTIARRSPRSIATAMYEPTPGRRKSRSPSVNASLTVRKNQPPAIDIIEFQTRPMTDEESSTVRKRFQKPKRWRRATSWSSVGIARSDAM